jgi:hypothetical protein
MEPENSLLYSQVPSTGPYPELGQSSPYQPILSMILFNITLPLMSKPSFWFSHQNPTCHGHLVFLDLIILIILQEDYKSWSFSLCSFLHLPTTSNFFSQNILLSTLFSNTLCLCSFLNVRDQVSQPYKTTGRIILLYILIFMFLGVRR